MGQLLERKPRLAWPVQLYGNRICTLALERFEHMPLLISKLQRDLFEMHQSTSANLCDPDWNIGLLCNVNKFPLDHDACPELIQLGCA